MAEKAFFYNALPDENSVTGYDRNYNADDLSDWLATVWETGVVKSDDGLKVVQASGMTVNVNAGKACILGKPYNNTSLKAFKVGTAPTGNTARYDLIVLQYNNETSTRHTQLLIKQNASISGIDDDEGIENVLIRSGKIFEICLAVIQVDPNATSIPQARIHDKRGNAKLCPWFTAVKGYDEYYDAMVQKITGLVVMETAGQRAITKISTTLYNEKYSIVNVYTNGIKEPSENYELQVGSTYIVVNFKTARTAGAKILVELENFIDGEGMSTALAQYSQWANAVATLQTAGEYDYLCNGIDDNIQISNIVKALYAQNFYHSMKLNIVGNFGFTAMASGSGDVSSRYKLFDFGTFTNVPKPRVVVDFSRCSEISVAIESGKYTYIFGGTVAEVVGANIYAENTSSGTTIRIFDNSAKRIKAEDCRFIVSGYINSLVAIHGTFTNCFANIANATENSYCFLPASDGMVKIIGGEYYAYTGDSSKKSAVVGQSDPNAVSILYGVSAPTSARSGFYQTNSLLQWTGGGQMRCTDLVSALPVTVVSGIAEIRGTIAMSKTNVY